MSTPLLPSPGWYTDPHVARQDRWWNGSDWTAFTHRSAGPLSFSPTYTRSYWVGPNRDAGRARFFGSLGTIVLLATVVFLIASALRAVVVPGPGWFGLVGFAVAGALHVVNIVFANRALRVSAALGARGLAISNIVVGSIEVIICVAGVLGTVVVLATQAS